MHLGHDNGAFELRHPRTAHLRRQDFQGTTNGPDACEHILGLFREPLAELRELTRVRGALRRAEPYNAGAAMVVRARCGQHPCRHGFQESDALPFAVAHRAYMPAKATSFSQPLDVSVMVAFKRAVAGHTNQHLPWRSACPNCCVPQRPKTSSRRCAHLPRHQRKLYRARSARAWCAAVQGLPSQTSPNSCSPSLIGEHANAATDTTDCEKIHKRTQVKPSSYRQETTKFKLLLNEKRLFTNRSSLQRKIAPMLLLSCAPQGFFQRSCGAFCVRLPQLLRHFASAFDVLLFTTSVVVSFSICLGISHRPQRLCFLVAARLLEVGRSVQVDVRVISIVVRTIVATVQQVTVAFVITGPTVATRGLHDLPFFVVSKRKTTLS